MKMLHATFLLIASIRVASANAQSNDTISQAFSSGVAPGKKCLRVTSISDRAPAQIYDCDNSPEEQWKIDYLDSGFTQIKIADSNFCLDALNIGGFIHVVISKCNQGPSQEWQYTGSRNLRLLAHIALLPLCLQLRKGNTDNGNRVEIAPCTIDDRQLWIRMEN